MPRDARWTGAVTALEDPPQTIVSARRFTDRHDAGRRLAAVLERFRAERPVIVGMPRGGVPVAAEVASALGAPLDVAIVRKVGAPQNPEFAIGAVAEGGVRLIGGEAARALALTERDVRVLFARAEDELASYVKRYRGSREPVAVAGRTVILVDDGLATGRSAAAALQSLRRRGAERLILAVPVAAAQSARALGELADEVVAVELPEDLWAVGYWYEEFAPTSDAEVLRALAHDAPASPPAAHEPGGRAHEPVGQAEEPFSQAEEPSGQTGEPFREEIAIDAGAGVRLTGELVVPGRASVVVVFAHGSGSGRHSRRNQAVASWLNEAGFATLLFDLLSESEALNRANVFDIPLLAARLIAAGERLAAHERSADLRLAYFGASTGAAAALTAAATLGERVSAVISRGGRPDLAENLSAVSAPTLLIVGGADREVLELNRQAQQRLRCASELKIVPGAGHLFEEPGALEQVGRLAVEWLLAVCAPASAATGPGEDRANPAA